jgi:hypothetical protein
MRIIILGCDHKLQLKKSACAVLLRTQQTLFKQEVIRIIDTEQITIVCEEIGESNESILKEPVNRRGILYVDIDMPRQIKLNVQCGPGYADKVSVYDFPSEMVWQENVNRCHLLREEYMFNKTIAAANSFDNVLLICGQIHQYRLTQKFANRVA